MEKFVYGMYGNEDQLDNNDRLYNRFLDIFILHPRTHIKQGKALYTDYEICVKTNHPEFAIKDSHVRRRYSEFAWLKARLGMNDIMMTTAPSLPGKKYVGRFKDPFLIKRQMGLQSFMNRVVEVNPFLSDPALHLFLQTDLSITQMESYLKHGVLLSNIRDRVIAEQRLREQREKMTDIPPSAAELQCKERMCTLSRSYSLDTMLSIRKNDNFEEKTSGRGWSNYIGDGVCHNEVLVDKDVTDFPTFNSSNTYTKQSKKTARVLPGGQLQLADDSSDQSEMTTMPKPQRRPLSWHGKTLGLFDFLLDSYDVIESTDPGYIDSMSISHNLNQHSSESTLDTNNYSSSYSDDDGIEIDIMSRLEEYTIISPIPQSEENILGTQMLSGAVSNGGDSVIKKIERRKPSNNSISSRNENVTTTDRTSYASLDAKGFRHSDSE